MESQRSRPAAAALVAAAAVAGLALRVAVHESVLGRLDADEAVWGLMAKQVLDGELAAFYWAQGYGGTLEVLLTAPFVALFGLGTVTIRIVPVVLTAVAALLVWRVGRRTVGATAGVAAALLFWVFPPYLVWKSLRAHGFYGSGTVLTLAVLLLVLRLAERPTRRDAALLGAAAAIAWWQTPQSAAIVLPAVAWLTVVRRDAWRHAWAAVPTAALALLPWLVSNLRHNWWSFVVASGDGPGYATRLRGFFSATLPMALGLRVPFTSDWLLGTTASAAVYAALLVALAVLAYRRRSAPLGLLVAVAAAYPFVYGLSWYTWLVDEPRYVVLLMPVLVLLLALPLTSLPRAAVAVAAGAALSAGTIALLAGSPEYERRADGHHVPRDFGPLVAELDRRGIDRVYADYWIAMRLTFETDERVVASEAAVGALEAGGDRVLPPRPERIRRPAYDEELRRSVESPAYVFGGEPEEDVRESKALLEREGYRRVEVGGFELYERGERSRRRLSSASAAPAASGRPRDRRAPSAGTAPRAAAAAPARR